MASSLLKINNVQSVNTTKHSFQSQNRQILSPHLAFPAKTHHHHHHRNSNLTSTIQSSLSFPTPPASREDAILQAKTSLSTTLEKPLNNPKLAGKLKKLKQPRFRVEIPVVDDSPSSLSELALQVFGEMPIRRKGSPVKILILWPNSTLTDAGTDAFKASESVQHFDISLVNRDSDTRSLNSAEVAVFMAPEVSQLEVVKRVTDSFYPKPVVIFNPRWGFEEESRFGDLNGFVSSFEVVFSFLGLEVRGLLSKRRGMVYKIVRDGVLSGERWNVLVEEEGELKRVCSFKTRPSITEVENVLYNLMAVNSPITKSAKFLKGLLSNVTKQSKSS